MYKVFKPNRCRMKKPNRLGTPSLEFMKLQDDDFFDKLKAIIAVIRQDSKFTTKTIFEAGLEKAIFDRLGMSIEINMRPYPTINAAIELPEIDRNHIFYRALTTSFPNDVGKAVSYFQDEKMRIGFVDVDKIKVGGIFSRIPMRVFLNQGLFHPDITDGEIATTILHELGHGFTFFYYLLHTAMCSFISNSTATQVMGAKGDNERVIIIERGARVLGLDGVSVNEMLTQTPEQIAGSLQALYINSTVSNLRSETGFGMYELRACEQLADWFAVKLGSGLESATLQEKLLTNRRKYEKENTARSRLSFKTAFVYGAYVIRWAIPTPTILSDIFHDNTISKYDNDSARIKYMRHALIDELRDANLPDELTSKLTKQIDSIKEVEDRVAKSEDTFSKTIADFFRKRVIPNYRRNVSNVEMQKTIEEAMYNDSLVWHAKMKGALK